MRFFELQPHERVLDIGCGPGRMAVPLTQYLTQEASTPASISLLQASLGARKHINSRYPNFEFKHLDLQHPVYNPEGQTPTATSTCLFKMRPLISFVRFQSLPIWARRM